MLDIEDFERKYRAIVNSEQYTQLQEVYNKAKYVFFFGHGGNMGVAEHAAIDHSRLTDKNVFAPGGESLSHQSREIPVLMIGL